MARNDRRSHARSVRRPPGMGARAAATDRADARRSWAVSCAAAVSSIGLPGHGWRGDLRADEKVVQGSRTYVPVMPEAEWYRAEAEQTEVFAPLVPVERVWVEEYGMAGIDAGDRRRRVPAGVARRAAPAQPGRRPGRGRSDRPPGRAVARGRRRTAGPASRDRAAHQRRRRRLRPGDHRARLVPLGMERAARREHWRSRCTCSGSSRSSGELASRRRRASRPDRPIANCQVSLSRARCRSAVSRSVPSLTVRRVACGRDGQARPA